MFLYMWFIEQHVFLQQGFAFLKSFEKTPLIHNT